MIKRRNADNSHRSSVASKYQLQTVCQVCCGRSVIIDCFTPHYTSTMEGTIPFVFTDEEEKPREVNKGIQGNTACMQQTWDLNPGGPMSEAASLSCYAKRLWLYKPHNQ